MTTSLSIPEQFVRTALSMPDRVDQALAEWSPEERRENAAQADAMLRHAMEIKAHTSVINALMYVGLQIKAGIGVDNPSKQGQKQLRGGTPPKFDKDTIAAYRKLAKHRDLIRPYYELSCKVNEESDNNDHRMSISDFLKYVSDDGTIATKHGNKIVEWYTPEQYIEAARKVMGGIDLDPATSKFAQKTVKAAKFYTAEDDGLGYDWAGRVYLNPPFKMPDVANFVDKLCDEFEAKRVTQAVLLTNNNTDTGWWHRAIEVGSAVCLTRGRINFYNKAGEFSSPTNGQSFIYFGGRVRAFFKAFSDIGVCLNGYS